MNRYTPKELWGEIKEERLDGYDIPFITGRSNRRRYGSFQLYSMPVHRENTHYSLAIVQIKHDMYSIWVTSARAECSRLIRNRLIEHLAIPHTQIWVFNKLRVNRGLRYHVCNGSRSLYYTNLKTGRFSQSQLVVGQDYIGFHIRMLRQFEKFIIQQIY